MFNPKGKKKKKAPKGKPSPLPLEQKFSFPILKYQEFFYSSMLNFSVEHGM